MERLHLRSVGAGSRRASDSLRLPRVWRDKAAPIAVSSSLDAFKTSREEWESDAESVRMEYDHLGYVGKTDVSESSASGFRKMRKAGEDFEAFTQTHATEEGRVDPVGAA